MPMAQTGHRGARTASPRLALLGALLFALPVGAGAATFTVSSNGDVSSDPTTLRGAIAASEASTDAADTINITATGTIPLTQASGPLVIYNGQTVAGKTLTITGPGATSLAVDGGGHVGVFMITDNGTGSVAVTLSGLTVRNGANATGGAGIATSQTLALTNVVLSGSTTTGSVGGGLITLQSAVTMTGCDISGNTATADSSGNNGGSGGGICTNGGTLTLTNCTVHGNTGKYAGGIENYQATLTMTGCTISGNNATRNAAGLENDGTATLTGCTISGNSAAHNTGGISNVGSMTLTGCTVSGNSAPNWGGGFFNQGALTALNDTFSGNTAGVVGGGVVNYLINASDGGALTASYARCTLSGNSAAQEGGGVFVYSDDTSGAGGAVSLALTNCTFSGNSAGGDFGGGLYVQETDHTTSGTSVMDTVLTNCTISGNTAPDGGGGIDFYSSTTGTGAGPTCTVASSLIAGNTLTAAPIGTDPDCNIDGSALFTSGGSNLIGAGTAPDGFAAGTNHDQVGTTASPIDPALGAPADNGGPVQTMALLAGSPALDADDNTGVTTDARGLPRPSGARNDIGAFEHQGPAAAPDASTTTVGVTKNVPAPGVLANDTVGHDGSSLSAVLAAAPAHGTVTLNADGSFTYTPAAGFAGTDTFTYQAGDGVSLSAPAAVTLTVQDVTPPTTTATLDPAQPNGAAGYYSTAVGVTLIARDDASSPSVTFYSVDGGAQQTYNGSFSVSGDRSHTVLFHSTDAAGNTEAPAKSVSFQIDSTAPKTTAAPQSATTGFQVTLSATDNLSGIADTVYSVDGGTQTPYTTAFTVAGDGPHTVTYFSTDRAGNTETKESLSFMIQTPPSGPAVAHTFGAGLQMVSVPADYSAVPLGTALSQSNPRLAVWDPSALQYVLSPAAPADALRPGQGYWARFSQMTDLYDLGTPTPTDKAFTITLKKGWNMIGDPFPGSVSLSGIQVQGSGQTYTGLKAAVDAGVVAATLYSYPAGASAYQTTDGDGTLTPYAGYWVYSFQPCTLAVPAP